MAPIIEPVRIDGLREIVRAIRAVDADLAKALRLGANKAAAIVVDAARAKMPSRTGRAKTSVRAKSTRTAARVTSGGKRAPYVPWLDYGGNVGRGNTAHRPFIADGRYVYPAFRANREQFEKIYRDELQDIVRRAGLEVHG